MEYKMTWHETIAHIRKQKAYNNLVIDAYFSEDLKANVEKYKITDEFKQTLAEIQSLNTDNKLRILDIGAGNGISTIAFALEGYTVTALEPDSSETVGAGAIRQLIDIYELQNVDILECYAEDIPETKMGFDVVFARQAMHHAYHLENFISAAYNVLNPGGILMTIRDHVVENQKEKDVFLENHPLHKFYGGENAFSELEYKNAMIKAGFRIEKTLKPSESVINFHPWSKEKLNIKLKLFSKVPFVSEVIWKILKYRWNTMPGRLFTFIAIKP